MTMPSAPMALMNPPVLANALPVCSATTSGGEVMTVPVPNDPFHTKANHLYPVPEIMAGTALTLLGMGAHYLVSKYFSGRRESGFQGLVIGINHSSDPNEPKLVKKHIEDAFQKGAKTIALEMSPLVWSDKSVMTHFKKYGLFAQSLGMSVLCLESDAASERAEIIDLAKGYIGPEGTFERDCLKREIIEVRGEIPLSPKRNPFAPPEVRLMHDEYAFTLKRLKAVDSFLDEIGSDIDRYAAVWKQTIVVEATDEMAKAIAAQKPDLVLVGAQHARRFSKKYRSLDLVKTYEWDADDLKRYPNVSRVLSTQDEHKVKLLIHLWGRVLDTKSDPEQVPQLYEEASRREPDLVRLTLRAFSTLRPELMAKLVPHEDLAFLKMPVSEAQKRVVAAFGIDKWIG